ncbi:MULTISPECIES: GNAT family N-acetyltransferase [unclassified Serratia (in: enterobacteria)]|uniref:GNAT family N-acetyltransferase n=1 Tax=unclassified Serratia (in: enterobacteria) TaxID=2647522 RepID=UPI00307611DA
MSNPYKECPTYETSNFIIRLISENDAEGLLKCYSDVNSRSLFNSDRCMGGFNFNTIEEMKDAIIGWLDCYEREEFIRYSIVNRDTGLAVGTIEMFATVNDYKVSSGILRLDISSEYETEMYLTEVFAVCSKHFFDTFSVEEIVTKAIPVAEVRINSLLELGFTKYESPDREHYYVLSK